MGERLERANLSDINFHSRQVSFPTPFASSITNPTKFQQKIAKKLYRGCDEVQYLFISFSQAAVFMNSLPSQMKLKFLDFRKNKCNEEIPQSILKKTKILTWKWNAFYRSCDSSLQVWVLIFLFWILNQSEIYTANKSMNSGLVTVSSLLFHFRCIQQCKNMQTVQTRWCLFVCAIAIF